MGELATYDGTAVADSIHDAVDYGGSSDPLVFLMGPYRLLDPAYLYPQDDFSLPADPLSPQTASADPDSIESALRTIAQKVTDETAATAFIASDIDIPTRTEVSQRNLDESGMSVIDQSVAYAKASVGNAFVFTRAGLTTGVGAEAGAIPEYFQLRSVEERKRDPRTFCIFSEANETADDKRTYEPVFSSASINEMDDAYDLRFRYFVDRESLVEKLISFVESYAIPLSE